MNRIQFLVKMRLNLLVMLAISLFAGLFSGCYYDVAEELYAGCDTASVSYSATVAPMLQSNGCLGCHSGQAGGGGGVALDNQASISALQPGQFVSGADRMPPSSAPAGVLSDCDINKLRSWVNAGAPNN